MEKHLQSLLKRSWSLSNNIDNIITDYIWCQRYGAQVTPTVLATFHGSSLATTSKTY